MRWNDRRGEGRRTKPISAWDLPEGGGGHELGPDTELSPHFPYRHKEGSIRGTLERHGLMGMGPYPIGPRPKYWHQGGLGLEDFLNEVRIPPKEG